jgi:hypothetical protein
LDIHQLFREARQKSKHNHNSLLGKYPYPHLPIKTIVINTVKK